MKFKALEENNVRRTQCTMNIILPNSNAEIRSIKFLDLRWLGRGSSVQ